MNCNNINDIININLEICKIKYMYNCAFNTYRKNNKQSYYNLIIRLKNRINKLTKLKYNYLIGIKTK